MKIGKIEMLVFMQEMMLDVKQRVCIDYAIQQEFTHIQLYSTPTS